MIVDNSSGFSYTWLVAVIYHHLKEVTYCGVSFMFQQIIIEVASYYNFLIFFPYLSQCFVDKLNGFFIIIFSWVPIKDPNKPIGLIMDLL